jgi:RND superfamily putative drug exporter
VVLRSDPFATETFDQVPALRRAVKAAGGASVLVGGPTAEAYDYRKSATRDNFVVLPLALLVVFVILAILLRSLLAPLLLVLSVICPSSPRSGPASSSSSTCSASWAWTRRCRCSRSSSWSRWASTTTSS